VLFVPLIAGAFRCALQGAGEDGLELVAESGDPAVVGTEVVGLFVATGPDPYDLVERAAQSVAARLGAGRLRRDKPLPAFLDRFGWCTWDAFYQDVSTTRCVKGSKASPAAG
jgi:raffinose synthase